MTGDITNYRGDLLIFSIIWKGIKFIKKIKRATILEQKNALRKCSLIFSVKLIPS